MLRSHTNLSNPEKVRQEEEHGKEQEKEGDPLDSEPRFRISWEKLIGLAGQGSIYSFISVQLAAVAAEDIDPLRRRTGVEKMIDGEGDSE